MNIGLKKNREVRNRFTDVENGLWLPREKGGRGGWIGSLGLADANCNIIYRMDKQQSPTV